MISTLTECVCIWFIATAYSHLRVTRKHSLLFFSLFQAIIAGIDVVVFV